LLCIYLQPALPAMLLSSTSTTCYASIFNHHYLLCFRRERHVLWFSLPVVRMSWSRLSSPINWRLRLSCTRPAVPTRRVQCPRHQHCLLVPTHLEWKQSYRSLLYVERLDLKEYSITISASIDVNPFTPRISYGDFKVILTSESVDEILSYNHSNETSLAVLSRGTIYIQVFYKMKFGIRLNFDLSHSWEWKS